MSQTEDLLDYFGVCPTCHKNDGCINIGRGHWYYCKEHKVCWFVGSNLFSSWKTQTEEEQRRIYDELGFDKFERIEPLTDPRWNADYDKTTTQKTTTESPPWGGLFELKEKKR